MSKTLKKFISEFPTDQFVALDEEPKDRGGSWLDSLNLSPSVVFELLEVVYGEYKDLDQKYIFIDNKSTWGRYFKTLYGILRVYDYKGNCSIGYSGVLTPELKSQSKFFKEVLHDQWRKYIAIKSKIIKEKIKENPLDNFMKTFLAVSILLKKAKENGSYIEALALFASQVDAMLRFGMILKIQIRDGTKNYDSSLIFQKGKKFKNERAIFNDSLNIKLITKVEFNELSKLYDFRNCVVHRYFISDLEYSRISEYLDRYEKIIEKLGKKLELLEQEQVKKGVGMTTSNQIELNDETARFIMREQHMKIDSSKYVTVIPKRKGFFLEQDDC
jgi:hypothetical protein